MTTETIQAALQSVKYPGFSRDIVSFGLIKDTAFADGVATVSLAVTTGDPKIPVQLKQDVEAAILALEGVHRAEVQIAVTAPESSSQSPKEVVQEAMKGVRHRIAIASGKGGVGKSTFSVNLACAFEQLLRSESGSIRVGIMDCDIYGPSVPMMMGLASRPEVSGDSLVPVENFGIKVMSMGLLIDELAPVVWRGPMVMKTIQQFATNVDWGDLDMLIIDLPPGTGDAQLSLVQTLPLDGAVIVTTPQRVATSVAQRGAMMFEKVNVPLLGVAENMSYLLDKDGQQQYLFGQGGGERAAESLETDFLGQIPLDPSIREGGDRGIPILVSHPEGAVAQSFLEMAKRLMPLA